MEDQLPRIEVDCPLCGQRHVADAFDHGDEIEWSVACRGVEARMRAPLGWLIAAEAEILTTVRHELVQRLVQPAPGGFPIGTGPQPLVEGGAGAAPASGNAARPELDVAPVGSRPSPASPRGLGAIVLALKLPRGSKVEVEGDCWIFRSPDGAEVRLREPFDDPATMEAAIAAGRKRAT